MRTVLNKEGSLFVSPPHGLPRRQDASPSLQHVILLFFFSDSYSDYGQLWKQWGCLTCGGTHVSHGPHVTWCGGHFRNTLPLEKTMVKAVRDQASLSDGPGPSGSSSPRRACPRSAPRPLPRYKGLWRLEGGPCNQTTKRSQDSLSAAPRDWASSPGSCAHGPVPAHGKRC